MYGYFCKIMPCCSDDAPGLTKHTLFGDIVPHALASHLYQNAQSAGFHVNGGATLY